MKKIYIYEIEPVTFLNFSIDVQSNILNLYNEFLRELNFEFQIFISNKKINVQKYITNMHNNIIKNKPDKFVDLINTYIDNISEQLQDITLYTTKFYIVISVNRDSACDINSLDGIIKKLDTIGCNTKRVSSKKELKLLIYECINKEVII